MFKEWKIGLILALTLALTGCFKVEIEAPQTIEQNSFVSFSAVTEGEKGDVSYKWLLDGELVENQQDFHTMFTATGSYELEVLAVDSDGNEANQAKTLQVQPQVALNDDFTLNVSVSNAAGFALTDAQVSVLGETALTTDAGIASFTGIPQNALMIIKVEKEGFISQTYQYEFQESLDSVDLEISLNALNNTTQEIDPTIDNTLSENELHTKISLPANSFVDAEGNIITDPVNVRITPIDAQTVGRAFLGGARAFTDEGEIVTLISTGMADFQFTSNGEQVSFVEGNAAVIEMDLITTTGADGRTFTAGDTIDMWWFDTEKGVWIEDGIGRVEESEQSPTGFKLIAEVTHFTTWNWDYYPDPESRANFDFRCTVSGQPLEQGQTCLLDIQSSAISSQYNVGPSGISIINGPSNVTFNVRATMRDGLDYYSADQVFESQLGDNDIVVNLTRRDTQNASVRCKVINESETLVKPCKVNVLGSIVEELHTGDNADLIGQFGYVKGDQFDLTAKLASGNSQTINVDTSQVSGYLDLILTFEVKTKRLRCLATINGSNPEPIPCQAIIEDDMGNQQGLLEKDFYGNPLGADFTVDKDALSLNFEVAAMFDTASVRYSSYNDRYYMIDRGQTRSVDLGTSTGDIVFTHNVDSSDLFRFECVDQNGNDLDGCYVRWYAPIEMIVFQDRISVLEEPNRIPSWIRDRTYIPQVEDGSGRAHLDSLGVYTRNYEVINTQSDRVIRFIFDEL